MPVIMLFFILFCYQGNGETTTGGFFEFECLTSLHHLLGDNVGLRIGLVVGIGGIGIDGAFVLFVLIQEVELDGALVSVLVALAANEPVVGTLCLAGYTSRMNWKASSNFS